MASDRIPTKLVVPIIKDYLAEQEFTQNRGQLPPAAALAEKAGVKSDTLSWRILNGRMKTLSFDTADRLLCAMGLFHLWWEWPLIVFYYAVDLSEKEETEYVKPARCRTHGILGRQDVYRRGTEDDGTPRWACRVCQSARKRKQRKQQRELAVAA